MKDTKRSARFQGLSHNGRVSQLARLQKRSSSSIAIVNTDWASITAVSRQAVATDFAQLGDGSLIEMVEHPDDPMKSIFAVHKDGNTRFADSIEFGQRLLVPFGRQIGFFSHIRFPKGVQDSGSARSLIVDMMSVVRDCLDIDLENAFLLSAFALSTWFAEQLPIAPYVALVGLPRAGKTTALRVLQLLCRRPLLVSDATSAAIHQVYGQTMPTLLIDETRTIGEQRALTHLLLNGSTPGFVALQKDKSFKCFGPKVVTWTELPNDPALNSRCIIVPLHETSRSDLRRPTDPSVAAAADELQKRLLQFRFEHFTSLRLQRIPGDHKLRGRGRDLYEALAWPLVDDESLRAFLLSLMVKQDEFNREPLSSAQAAVLSVLFLAAHITDRGDKVSFSGLTNSANAILKRQKETLQLSPHAVGKFLTSFGIGNRTRLNTGWHLQLDNALRTKIHDNVERYGIDPTPLLRDLQKHHLLKPCTFCDGVKVKSSQKMAPQKHLAAEWLEKRIRNVNSADRA